MLTDVRVAWIPNGDVMLSLQTCLRKKVESCNWVFAKSFQFTLIAML